MMDEASATPAWPAEGTESQVSKEPSPPLPVPSDPPSSVPGVAVPMDTQMDLDPPAAETTKEPMATEAIPEAASSSKSESVDISADANGSTSTPAANTAAATIVPEAESSTAAGPSSSQSIEKPPPPPPPQQQQQQQQQQAPTVTNDQPAAPKPKLDFASLPTRQYLDQTVVPILLQGLSWLAKTRPEDPVGELSKYLLEHKAEYDSTAAAAAAASSSSAAAPAAAANRQNSSADGTASSGVPQSK